MARILDPLPRRVIVTTTAARHRGAEPAVTGSTFRGDVQGVRAVAVLLVVLYHAGLRVLGGGFVGVDVFFVISGYLITGGIVRELRSRGRLSLAGFYIRRMARILPAAVVAISATVLLSWLLLPPTRWEQIAKDAIGSGLYVVNWAFAERSVDYLAQDQAPSPLQHFWSLAVEEQFYIVWPLLLIVVALVCRRVAKPLGLGLAVGLVLIVVPSLLWSIHYTGANPGAAYFVTTTRAWELGVGATVAVAAAYRTRPVPAGVATAGAWAGVGAIVLAALTFSDATPFPSYTALLPVLGAALLLWSGEHAPSAPVARGLSTRPMTWIGGLSYSLYLWHWPLLVIAAGVFGELSVGAGLLVVALAVLPAWISTERIEKPLQRLVRGFRGREGHQGSKLALGASFTVAGLVPALLLLLAVPSTSAPAAGGRIGALKLADGVPMQVVDSSERMTPSPLDAARDLPKANTNGCMLDHATTDPKVCSYGDRDSDRVIALVRDSHAATHIPGMSMVAKRAGYRLDTYTRGSCLPVTIPVDFQGKPYPECATWTENVTDRLVDQKPALVLTAMSQAYVVHGSDEGFAENREPIAESVARTWTRLQDAGVRVAAFRDIPRFDMVVPDCVADHLDSLSDCARDQDDVLPEADQQVLAARQVPGVEVIDLTDALCVDGVCPTVVHDVLVYRDSSHLTATYSRSLRTQLAEQVLPLLE